MANVTKEEIENFLKEKYLFKQGDLITIQNINDIKCFKEGNVAMLGKLFQPLEREKNVYLKWRVETKCNICEKVEIKELSKKALMEYILKDNIICNSCKEKKEKEKKKKISENAKRHENEVEELTERFVDVYLDPEKRWAKGMKINQKIQHLKNHLFNCYQDVISESIIQMSYYDFLKTPYWNAVSLKVKLNAGFKCQMCGSDENLSVHHRTYEHHGNELQHMEDLICVCQDCHQIFHDNKEEYCG